ncbi:hypothetical protein NMG60_11028672 [Bertholletia excelsa]
MGSELAGRRPPLSYFAGCMSPSCVPVHEEYTRIHLPAAARTRASRRWRRLIKRLVRESKSIYCGSNKPSTPSFQYDAVSYSQNFDDGCHREEYYYNNRYHPHQVLGELR